ncbi:hypothetical protein [Amycolatopsis regifaucium]|uniref:Uncharacterized protein n=1 Tax=Amycolatopsis regifaucium TaxID=546365 RepID=A0A154MJL5_9PSEU|nr:hypothetical protein [Amycolatopsis regifaucium]KZB83619.1 hypothetical protein AVL48_36080 [Amycolatopsis regifaucium]OKA03864.1 hypothetical protein ATP06_0234175 [Amycolatopsis regifaucium]SFJ65505.1 hypothetical protein SAMN04489731_1299 [Amycolatopsis regifaucium]
MRVIIQPSYRTKEARRHWAQTLERPVPFRRQWYAEVLSPAERTELDAEHPDGQARFWGATAQHDKKMDTLETGDFVLLTGQKQVRGIGTVGCFLRNDELARRLWTPDPARCLWRNVYTFRAFRPVTIPYERVWALPGFTAGDNFMGLRFLAKEKSVTIVAGLGVTELLASESGQASPARDLAAGA